MNLLSVPSILSEWSSQPMTPTGAVCIGLGVGVAAWTVQKVAKTGVWLYMRRDRDRRRDRKRQEAADSIEALRERLKLHPSKDVDNILKLKLPDLTRKLKAGELSPLQVLRAYQTKALEVHERTNCLIEVIAEAEQWAEEAGRGPRDGLLYGVPISIKDDIPIKGYDSTLGVVEYVGKPSTEDAAILKVLKQHGAIPFVRTNLPQLALSYESGNPIFGIVRNPHNLAHGPGGSSSGEAALIAAGGSILGFGSDIGGSLRVPAHFTGICTLKPTIQRMSNAGYADAWSAEQSILESVYGPLARSVDNVVLAMRAFWDESPLTMLDPMAVPLPFNNEIFKSTKKLRIGFYTDNGLFPPFPGCVRAVNEAKAILQQNGHEIVPWVVPNIDKAALLAWRVMDSDGGVATQELMKYDRIDPCIEPVMGPSIPYWLTWIIAKTMGSLMPKLAFMAKLGLGLKTAEYWNLEREYREYSLQVTKAWHETGLDALICPPFAFAAPPFGNANLCIEAVSYSMVFNILNYPAGVVPVTKVSCDDIDDLKDFPIQDEWHAKAKRAMEGAINLPMGVLVVGPRFKDEICLRLMKEIENALQKEA